MAENEQQEHQPALQPVAKPFSLIPVGLKEAALDSPTFRATAVHFGEQIDIVEKWLDNYVKSASRLSAEAVSLEGLVNTFLSYSTPPQQVSEAVLDHDYTLLVMKRYREGARDFWSSTLRALKRLESSAVEPTRSFLQGDLKNLKDARKSLDQSQKNFDGLLSRYAGQSKTKEASSLREDAFQLHEARRAYLKASMDFCVLVPQVRTNLDKLLVKIFADQWREMKSSRETTSNNFNKWSSEMERVRGWSREMENSERVFKRELQLARKQIEENAEYTVRPSRELDDYATSTVPYLGSQGGSTGNLQSPAMTGAQKSEKQGWLFQRTITGKPARTVWVRRWFFVKNGIFGWLVQGARSGAVEESEKIGVLLCGIRPAFQEERRFCFEVKTKDTTMVLQAETQADLMEWITAFEVAKRRALEDPASTDSSTSVGSNAVDPAFAISPPSAPEFAARNTENIASYGNDDLGFERAGTLLPGDRDPMAGLASRSSIDISSRRNTATEREGESSRDHAARIIQKLDLHRKSTASPQLTGTPLPSPASAGGIASLISASHNMLPVGPVPTQSSSVDPTKPGSSAAVPTSTLAPSTLANPPAPTNLSKTAVIVSGERDVGLGRGDGGMPSGLMANLWGSTNWGHVNRLERSEIQRLHGRSISQPPSPGTKPVLGSADVGNNTLERASPGQSFTPGPTSPLPVAHRKTISLGGDLSPLKGPSTSTEKYPNYYPLPLKAQDAQFHMLFPNVPWEEKVVLVFRATWNPNEQQEFPGRVYVTMNDIYFYSHHMGLVLITGFSLLVIDEVTAAPGKDCDFLFLHLHDDVKLDGATRVTIKTFLEPLKLLQRRLNFLIRNCHADQPSSIEDVLKTLIRLEIEDAATSPSGDSSGNVSGDTASDVYYGRRGHDLKASLRIDGNLFPDPSTGQTSKNAAKFKLPPQPVVYAPQGMTCIAVERDFPISAKALFHLMFGDKSALFQILYCAGWAQKLTQSPWVQPEQGHYRRDFQYEVDVTKGRGGQPRRLQVTDHQVIEVLNDHLCYVIADKKTPWYLPHSQDFTLISKIVITHVSKSCCKLVIYTKVDWTKSPFFGKALLERQALRDLEIHALDLADMITEQVAKLGKNSGTRRAIQIFGLVGQQIQATQFSASDLPPFTKQRRLTLRSQSFIGLVTQTLSSYAGKALSAMLSWLGAFVGGILKICTAHTLLLGLLLASIGVNLFFSSRDTFEWWAERNAAKFMARVGVGPNAQMSKAIYIQDLDDIGFGSNHSTVLAGSDNKCLATFQDLISQTDPNAAVGFPSHTFAEPSTKSTARRLHRTRQHIGSYRHDLLVAMQVVNSVEREVMQAEWENWLLDENIRCRQIGRLLQGREGKDDSASEQAGQEQQILRAKDKLEDWYQGYCGSCQEELDKVTQGKSKLPLA